MKYVVGIGAANVDIYGKSNIKIRQHFDHPAIIKTAIGGVTRNILESISKLGVNAKLLTALGDDSNGDLVIKHSNDVNIDTSGVLRVKDQRTGVFMQVQDNNNDMHLALCDMSVNKNINVSYLKKHSKLLRNANAIIIDPSLDKEVLDYIFETFKTVPIFVDPISDLYAKKIKPYLKNIFCIKPNTSELSVLAGMEIKNKEDIEIAAKKVIKKGVKHIFVSLGKDGCLYTRSDGVIIHKKLKPVKKMANASGAGDNFFAAVIYSFVSEIDINKAIDLALAAGISAITCLETINPRLSIKLLEKIIKENV